MLTSQPFALFRSQFAKPALHTMVHMPAWQAPVALASGGQSLFIVQPPVVVVVVLAVVVVVDVGAGSGAHRRLVPLAVTWCVPNWSWIVAVGVAFGHFTL
jgi:hypothetical protein